MLTLVGHYVLAHWNHSALQQTKLTTSATSRTGLYYSGVFTGTTLEVYNSSVYNSWFLRSHCFSVVNLGSVYRYNSGSLQFQCLQLMVFTQSLFLRGQSSRTVVLELYSSLPIGCRRDGTAGSLLALFGHWPMSFHSPCAARS